MAYCEHEGWYRHTAGSSGPRKSWYARTKAISRYRTSGCVPSRIHLRGGSPQQLQLAPDLVHLARKLLERCRVRRALCPDHDVQRERERQQALPDQFAQPAFHRVALYCRLAVARHHDPCTHSWMRGSPHPHEERVRSERLPLCSDALEVGTPRQACRRRKAESLRRLRTSTEVLPSAACAPSCGGG